MRKHIPAEGADTHELVHHVAVYNTASYVAFDEHHITAKLHISGILVYMRQRMSSSAHPHPASAFCIRILVHIRHNAATLHLITPNLHISCILARMRQYLYFCTSKGSTLVLLSASQHELLRASFCICACKQLTGRLCTRGGTRVLVV